ncbi:MAG TPA: aldehyde dehydrogenase family protein [Chloroflexota bacterium]|nr:aldehyde dehydrogenase family protein [Chloroflexota bacterium]
MPVQLRSYVGSEWRGGDRAAPDISPANPNEIVAEVLLAGKDIAAQAVEASAAAFPAWRRTPAPARGEILRRTADLLDQRAETIAADLTREEGKTLPEALGETKRAVAILRYCAGQTLEPDGQTFPSHSPQTFLYARREPVGAISVITPWNFPIAIPAWKIAPALAYGNTVVWKPAGLVPLTATHFVSALIDAGLPPGVLTLMLGSGSEVGDVLATHEGIDAVTFTGSNDVGKTLQLKAIQAGKKVQLEMGGKNPAIVLADADLELAVDHVGRGAFLSAGQKCTATSRVIVERPVFDEFRERLAALANGWKLGEPMDTDTKVGPLVSEERLESVSSYLDVARASGARFVAGGERAVELGAGYYVKPTVIDGLDPLGRVAQEEIFGPVAALLPAGSFEEALSLTNGTRFGLTASVFTRDLSKALRFAQDAQVGVVKVNQESAGLEFQVPFGGMKQSSAGPREQGKAAAEFFTQWKTVYLDAPL